MYKEIHIWAFPLTKTFVLLKDGFRKQFFGLIEERLGFSKACNIINKAASIYGQKRSYNKGHFYSWRVGFKNDGGKKKTVRPPAWVLYELSKEIDVSLLEIEKNIASYGASGTSTPIKNPNLPLKLTPELVSVIFHLCGDGHIGVGWGASHYRQVNQDGLYNFIAKLKNTFGDFKVTISEGSKVYIPKIITYFYQHYFKLNSCSWDTARIPIEVRQMPKAFQVAGLTSFIIDEGHIGEVIEIYSKNENLLTDIKEIATSLKYNVWGPKLKRSKGRTDIYRVYISTRDAQKLYKDIKEVAIEFPTCALAQKTKFLKKIVERQTKHNVKTNDGYTKMKILQTLTKENKTTSELAGEFNLAESSVREHLATLEEQKKIERIGKKGPHAILFKKIV